MANIKRSPRVREADKVEYKNVRAGQSSSVMDFWQSRTIEELAEAQGVKPLSGVNKLFGTWPGGEDDGFEESVNQLRH